MKKLIKLIAVINCLLSITVILTPTVSWGGVDGKGIWCKINHREFNDEYRYLFKMGGVYEYNFTTILNDRWEFFEKKTDHKYSLTHDQIIWSDPLFYFSLNRKTLILRKILGGTEVTYDCKVYSQKDFFNKLEDVKNKLKSEYDDKTKDNKI